MSEDDGVKAVRGVVIALPISLLLWLIAAALLGWLSGGAQ